MMSRLEPRDLQIAILTTFTFIGQTVLSFQVTIVQILLTVVLCRLLDSALGYSVNGKLAFPKSAIITGLSIALLLRSDSLIPFILTAVIGICTKYWIQYRGDHIFNPSNIGIVIVSVLFPVTVATAPLQWGFYWAALFVIATAGTYIVYKVGRFPVIFSFLAGFLTIGAIRMALWDKSFHSIFNEFMWGGLLIFTFYMITDPKTSPRDAKGQVIFGFSTALLAQAMIQMEIHSAVFISLAMTCIARFLWRWAADKQPFGRRTTGVL